MVSNNYFISVEHPGIRVVGVVATCADCTVYNVYRIAVAFN